MQLIKAGKAYVCDLTADQIREYRGTLTEPGKESPYRNRSVEENLDLFARMKAGEFPDGSRTLRAKIDMASPNFNLRDPIMYRILHAEHHRTGNEWCIYPMYDYAHGQSDSIEGITHSICTLEFEDHRPLYDWYIEALGIYHPQQIEFDRLNLTYTLLSKRKLLHPGAGRPRARLGRSAHAHPLRHPAPRLHARGDAQLLRVHRRSPRPMASIELGRLEYFVREDLNKRAPARDGRAAPAQGGHRQLPRRPGRRDGGRQQSRGPRGRHAQSAVLQGALHRAGRFPRRSAQGILPPLARAAKCACATPTSSSAPAWSRTPPGEITEVHCTYDPATRGGNAPDGRKVKATIHWVSAAQAVSGEVRLYDNLFLKEDPNQVEEGQDFTANLNPKSLEVLAGLQAGTLPGRCRARRALPVRAPRLLLRRSRFRARQAGLQPHRDPERRVGQNREAGQAAEMIILGIGGLLGDAAAAVLKDGELVAAVEESKLVRRRTHWGGLDEMPEHAIATCLQLAGAKPEQVDAVAVVRPIPESDFHLKLRAQFPNSRIIVVEHHLAHAASAYYPSPFDEATVLTLDRGGDFRCGSRWQARGAHMSLEHEQYSPDSIGDLYGRVCRTPRL